MRYHWPGNVRQLENVIERLIALEPTEIITHKNLPGKILHYFEEGKYNVPTIPDEGIELQSVIDEFEKDIIFRAMKKANWVKKDAAQLLKVSFRSMRYRLDKYGISKPNLSKGG